MPGVDLVLPDFECLRQHADRIEAVVLTHGHEDHVGSLPYLLREFDLKVYATRLTLALIAGKLEEHGVTDNADLHEITPGDEVTSGPFTHALPPRDALDPGRRGGGRRPAQRRPAAHRRLQARPDADRRARHRPPGDRGRGRARRPPAAGRLDERRGPRLVGQRARGRPGAVRHRPRRAAPGRGGVLRQPHPPDPAGRERRPPVRGARSRSWAAACTRASPPPARSGTSTSTRTTSSTSTSSNDQNRATVVVISTGSQGEPLSALSLMAAREHKWVKLQPGDTVVLSSSVIPGNETAIHRVIDGLYRSGADVFHVPTSAGARVGPRRGRRAEVRC